MLYCSLDMAHYGINCYFSFWAIFYSYLPNSLKSHNLKKMTKDLDISSFYNSVPKIMVISYTVPEIWCVTDAIISYSVFTLLPP